MWGPLFEKKKQKNKKTKTKKKRARKKKTKKKMKNKHQKGENRRIFVSSPPSRETINYKFKVCTN